MHEEQLLKNHSQYHLLWVGSSSPPLENVLPPSGGTNFSLKVTQSGSLEGIDLRGIHILVLDHSANESLDFKKTLLSLENLPLKPTVLVYGETFSVSKMIQLNNEYNIFGISQSVEGLTLDIQQAINEFSERKSHFGSLKKIRNQNSRLELLTKNLEKIVLDRTRQDTESHAETLQNVKTIQDILRFIKLVARAETLEDVLSVVRGDLKKFHELMPPLLYLSEGPSLLKGFYFQSKQFVERLMSIEGQEAPSSDASPRDLQIFLSGLLGRPFGQVENFDLNWNVKNFSEASGNLVFEHSLDEAKLVEFRKYFGERLPVLQLAIENILLRDRSQKMARQWSNTFNNIQDPILIIDADYKMNLTNISLGTDSTGICYKDFANRSKPCVGCPVSLAVETARPQSADIHCLGKTFRLHSFPILLESQDRVTHVIHQYVDMTDTRDLQGRVVQGEKMAAIGMLAGNVAHELNNPLTGIYSLSDLLLGDLDSKSNTYKDLVEVRDAAKRCQIIIKDLLEFSDVGLRKMQIIDLNSVVGKTLPLLKMALRNHNCKLNLTEVGLPAKIQPQLFQQVIFNIVNNGCQAMDDGGDLSIESEKVGGYAIITIRDTGPGIPEALQDVIFDPFFTTKDEGEGTGLGLSMSRSVIETFEGTLTLNRDYTNGSEFVIKLPLGEV